MDIKRELEQKTSLREKVLLAEDLLKNTDIIKSETALCQFDDEVWSAEKNYLKKFLEYRKVTSMAYGDADCDVSLFSMVMYALLDEKLGLENIALQHYSQQKYEFCMEERRYRGDTLTSALHILKLYLGCLWKRIDEDAELKAVKSNSDFYELFSTVSRWGIPVSPEGEWLAYCYEHSDIIWNAMDEEAKQFLKCYFMFGNYMCIPGNSYRLSEKMYTSFNMARSNRGKWDTVDTLLMKIYCYYKCDDKKWLKAIFTDKKEELTAETLQWLEHFTDWSDFVKKNELSAFVEEKSSIPISMKTGQPIALQKMEEYDAIPKNYQEFLMFFQEASKRIIIRSERIHQKISLF